MADTFAVTPTGVGLPDYSAPKPLGQSPAGITYSLSDLAELAARIGSINTFDRRGNVIGLDDFEDPIIKWDSNGTVGAGAAVRHSSLSARSGAQCLQLVMGNAIGNFTQILKTFSVSNPSKIGVEWSFAKDISATLSDLEIVVTYTRYPSPTLPDDIVAGVKYNQITYSWSIMDTTGAYQIYLTEPGSVFGNQEWRTAKIVFDLVNLNYLRLLLDGVTHNISSHDLRLISPSLPPDNPIGRLSVVCRANQLSAVSGPYWLLDDIIVTQDEPSNG